MPSRMPRGWLFIALMVCLACPRADAQPADPLKTIQVARETYENTIKRERDKVIAALRSLEAAASNDHPTAELLKEDREAFESDPSSLPLSTPDANRVYQQEVKGAFNALSRSWQHAIAELHKKASDEQANMFSKELDDIEANNPFIDDTDLLAITKFEKPGPGAWSIDSRSAVFGGGSRCVLKLKQPAGAEYEIEFDVARIIEDPRLRQFQLAFSGAQRGLLIVGSGEDGASVSLRDIGGRDDGPELKTAAAVFATSQESTHVVLSVRSAGVDVGIDGRNVLEWKPEAGRQMKLPEGLASEMGGSSLAIITTGSKFRIDSLTHRLLDPEPASSPATAANPRPIAEKPAPAESGPDPATAPKNGKPGRNGRRAANTKFVGDFHESKPSARDGKAEAIITQQDDTSITMNINLMGKRWRNDVMFSINGNRLEPLSSAPGKKRREVRATDVDISGTLDGNNLRLFYSGMANTGKRRKQDGNSKNNPLEGTITLTRQ